jgi:hypothetical protein
MGSSMAPFLTSNVDSKYKDLVDRNRPALELMARGTALANCDWGLDYHAALPAADRSLLGAYYFALGRVA